MGRRTESGHCDLLNHEARDYMKLDRAGPNLPGSLGRPLNTLLMTLTLTGEKLLNPTYRRSLLI